MSRSEHEAAAMNDRLHATGRPLTEPAAPAAPTPPSAAEEMVPAAEPGPLPRSWRRTRNEWLSTGFIAGTALVFMIPFYWLVVSSLRPAERIFADAGRLIPTSVTLDNFVNLFNETPVITWFTNSVILAVGQTVGSILVVTMAAYALARITFRGRNAIFIGVLATQTLPFHLLLIPLFLLMINVGMIDTRIGVIAPLLAHPFGLFFMRQYLLGLPQDLFDAARVDGATEYQLFWKVALPLAKPALATLAVLFSLESWNDLLWPLIVLRSDQKFTMTVGIVSQLGLYRPRWDLVFTASMIAVVPVVLLFLKLRKVFISGLGQLGTGSK